MLIYLQNVLERFDMKNRSLVAVSMNSDLSNIIMSSNDTASQNDIYWYESIIWSLIYFMIMTRLDIASSLFILSRYTANSNHTQFKTAVRLLHYITSILHLNSHYEGAAGYVRYSGADLWSRTRQSPLNWRMSSLPCRRTYFMKFKTSGPSDAIGPCCWKIQFIKTKGSYRFLGW